MDDLSKPLTLKCGLALPNRLVKAAMAELMADSNGLPNDQFCRAYSQWAQGGWGMLLTGNVFVDPAYLGNPAELSIPATVDERTKRALAVWQQSCSSEGTPTLVQLSHAGRQSMLGAGTRSICTKTLAPSAVALNLGPGLVSKTIRVVAFGTPREMSTADINKVIDQFVHSAKVVADAGFAGVQIHAAHGYLLSTFLNTKTNLRQDEWGGSALDRVRIVVEIIKRIRDATPRAFAIGVKFNSADHQDSQAMDESMIQVKAIVETGVDFMEISGGSWEDPQMMQSTRSARTQEREAYFLSFAKAVRAQYPDVLLMVTGGFRTRRGMATAIREGDCDLIGIARPAVLNPSLPKNKIFNSEIEDTEVLYTKAFEKPWLEKITGNKIAGSGAESKWYSQQIRKNGIIL